jgi:hypothetical protein
LLTIGKSVLGLVQVNGRSLVPNPPISINAFIQRLPFEFQVTNRRF